MSLKQSLQQRVTWTDFFGVALMSVAAPWIAAYIHSACVFHRGIGLDNAEVGGEFFYGKMPLGPQPGLGIASIFIFFCLLSVPTIPTLLVLLSFRKRQMYLWPLWICCVVFWTWVLFKMEGAIH